MNSPRRISKNWCFHYDIVYNNRPLAILCHVVYATLGLTLFRAVHPATVKESRE
jgi:hypothetical protein